MYSVRHLTTSAQRHLAKSVQCTPFSDGRTTPSSVGCTYTTSTIFQVSHDVKTIKDRLSLQLEALVFTSDSFENKETELFH